MIILGKVRPLSHHLAEAHPQVSIIARSPPGVPIGHTNATSQLYYVLYGRGFAAINGRLARWEKGDFLTLYWVHDEPLLRYLGAKAHEPKFQATKFHRADAVAKLEDIASRPGANEKSRVSVLLANANQSRR